MPAIRPLNEDLQKQVELDINETTQLREDSLQHIKDWLSKQPHLPVIEDDQFLINFLRGCKYSLERVKQKIEGYFTVRSILPEFFSNRDPCDDEIRQIVRLGYVFPLPKVSPSGARIFISHNPCLDIEDFNLQKAYKIGFMLMDYLIQYDDYTLINGAIFVNDFHTFTVRHFACFNLGLLKKIEMVKRTMPTRMKQIHYINSPPFAEPFAKLFKPFMKDKIEKRVYLHGKDLTKFYEFVPQELLPNEYGGNAGTINEILANCEKMLISKRDWFLESQKLVVDETKRQGKPKTIDEIFGIEGSFRALSVD